MITEYEEGPAIPAPLMSATEILSTTPDLLTLMQQQTAQLATIRQLLESEAIAACMRQRGDAQCPQPAQQNEEAELPSV